MPAGHRGSVYGEASAIGSLAYRQVDVFADGPLAGNGLAVVITDQPLAASSMQALTCELRQFETIFLTPGPKSNCFDARVFTMDEELPFAGHPAVGAAAVLHERAGGRRHEWLLRLPSGEIALTSSQLEDGYWVSMNQGQVRFGEEIALGREAEWLACFGIDLRHLDRRVPICVASTGLPYLLVPVTSEGLAMARITSKALERRLGEVGAKFAYLFDIDEREGRTWDNTGAVEDIATGSAAGPLAGILVRYGFASAGVQILLRQGRFVGRPSKMTVEVSESSGSALGDVILSGKVVTIARGQFDPHVVLHVSGAGAHGPAAIVPRK